MDERAVGRRTDIAPAQAADPDAGETVLSRRDLLRGAALGGLALFLAACGSTATPAPGGTPAAVSYKHHRAHET
jgi:hypothetical protein